MLFTITDKHIQPKFDPIGVAAVVASLGFDALTANVQVGFASCCDVPYYVATCRVALRCNMSYHVATRIASAPTGACRSQHTLL